MAVAFAFLLFGGIGLWMYTGWEIFLLAAVPAAVFVIVATFAAILLLLGQINLTGRRGTE